MPKQQRAQKELNIKKGDSCVLIQVSDQTYVKVYDKKGILILFDRSQTTKINAILEPGEYTVESDGKIRSARSTVCEEGEKQLE